LFILVEPRGKISEGWIIAQSLSTADEKPTRVNGV
jgi:hypothetical protein